MRVCEACGGSFSVETMKQCAVQGRGVLRPSVPESGLALAQDLVQAAGCTAPPRARRPRRPPHRRRRSGRWTSSSPASPSGRSA